MRKNNSFITNHKGTSFKPKGSSKFTSPLSQIDDRQGIVSPPDPYNWINYKYAVAFFIFIGTLSYLAVDYLFF